MFGNQNIHFWEGLLSKCLFLPLVAVFYIFGILFFFFFFFFFFFAAILDFTDVKNVTEGKKEGRGPDSVFYVD